MSLLATAGADELERAWSEFGPPRRYRVLRTVQLDDGTLGHAYVGGRRTRHAEIAAVLDAVLQDPTRRATVERAVIDRLASAQAERRRTAEARAAATRVEFSTMVRGEDWSMLAGLADPVADGQAVFRTVLEAMARPGSIVEVPSPVDVPPPLSPAAAAVCLALVDLETRLWLDARARTADVTAYLRFHCGAPIVETPRRADFALIADAGSAPALEAFAQGTDEEPERSATVIVQVDSLTGGVGVELAGPGIAERAWLRAGGLLQARPYREVKRMADGIRIETLNAWFGDHRVLTDIDLSIPANSVTAVIGPSGCGKSTFVRCIDRMHEVVPGARVNGDIRLNGESLYGPEVDPVVVRRRIGMVFPKPNRFPTMSIFDNVAAGLRLGVRRDRAFLNETVEQALRQAALWDEVKAGLGKPGSALSGGQQQRLCIARALAVGPEVLLMDEPCSALDPIATAKIEELTVELEKNLTVVIVTHNMQQAARVSEWTGFFLMGELVEFGVTREIFTNPRDKRTEDYITGRFG